MCCRIAFCFSWNICKIWFIGSIYLFWGSILSLFPNLSINLFVSLSFLANCPVKIRSWSWAIILSSIPDVEIFSPLFIKVYLLLVSLWQEKHFVASNLPIIWPLKLMKSFLSYLLLIIFVLFVWSFSGIHRQVLFLICFYFWLFDKCF